MKGEKMKNISFIVDGNCLCTDIWLLVDEIPIFFVCRDDSERYYIVLCVDMDIPRYNIVETPAMLLRDMLCGNIPMREVFTSQKEYWEVTANTDKIDEDGVVRKQMKDMPADELPDEGATYDLFTERIREYAGKIQGADGVSTDESTVVTS